MVYGRRWKEDLKDGCVLDSLRPCGGEQIVNIEEPVPITAKGKLGSPKIY